MTPAGVLKLPGRYPGALWALVRRPGLTSQRSSLPLTGCDWVSLTPTPLLLNGDNHSTYLFGTVVFFNQGNANKVLFLRAGTLTSWITLIVITTGPHSGGPVCEVRKWTLGVESHRTEPCPLEAPHQPQGVIWPAGQPEGVWRARHFCGPAPSHTHLPPSMR